MTREFSEYQPQADIPQNFPRVTERGAVGGAVTKFIARTIDRKYVVGDTHSEHRERYVACCSLVSDLIAYCRKKQAQDAAWTPSAMHKRVTEGLLNSPQLVLTPGEFDWVLRELSTCMKWEFSKEGDGNAKSETPKD